MAWTTRGSSSSVWSNPSGNTGSGSTATTPTAITVNQVAHGLSQWEPVSRNAAGVWVSARADTLSLLAEGLVVAVTTVNSFEVVVQEGVIYTYTGHPFSPAVYYFLAETGGLTTTVPTTGTGTIYHQVVIGGWSASEFKLLPAPALGVSATTATASTITYAGTDWVTNGAVKEITIPATTHGLTSVYEVLFKEVATLGGFNISAGTIIKDGAEDVTIQIPDTVTSPSGEMVLLGPPNQVGQAITFAAGNWSSGAPYTLLLPMATGDRPERSAVWEDIGGGLYERVYGDTLVDVLGNPAIQIGTAAAFGGLAYTW